MDIIFKAFCGVFIFMLLSFTGMQMIQSTMDAAAAENYYSMVSKRISESHFSPEVVYECTEDAKSKGYSLQVLTYNVNGSREIYGHIKMNYEFILPILGISREYCLENEIW